MVYVYDYCYLMWILSDHHAREHWWLRDNYQPERKTGSHLLSVYRCVPSFRFLCCRWRLQLACNVVREILLRCSLLACTVDH